MMGFSGTFYAYGAMNLVWAAMTWVLFPKATKKTEYFDQFKENLIDAPEDSDYESVTYCRLFAKPRFTFAAITSGLSYMGYTMIEPILAVRLTEFKLTQF